MSEKIHPIHRPDLLEAQTGDSEDYGIDFSKEKGEVVDPSVYISPENFVAFLDESVDKQYNTIINVVDARDVGAPTVKGLVEQLVGIEEAKVSAYKESNPEAQTTATGDASGHLTVIFRCRDGVDVIVSRVGMNTIADIKNGIDHWKYIVRVNDRQNLES